MLSVRLVAASLVAICAVGCGGSYSSPSPSPSPSSPSPTPATDGPSTAVTIPGGAALLADRAYAPDELSIDAGTTVTWTNTDTVAHTSTSDGNAWNSGSVAPGQQFSFTFQSAGTFTYHCAIHPGMVGTVTVR